MAISTSTATPYRATLPQPASAKMLGVRALENIIVFGFVLSVLLGAVRIGMSGAFRPTVLVMLPCMLYLLIVNGSMLRRIMGSRLGLCVIALFLLLGAGHLMNHDEVLSLEGVYNELPWENIVSIPLILFTAIIVGWKKEYRWGMITALLVGLAVHIICIAVLPPVVIYRAYGRMSGMLRDPNILLLHITPVYFIWLSTVRWKYFPFVMPVTMLPVIWAVFQTLSRTGLVSVMIGLLIVLLGAIYLLLRMKRWKMAAAIICFFPICLIALYLAMPHYFDKRIAIYADRLGSSYTGKSKTFLDDRMYWFHLMEQTSLDDHLLSPLGMGYRTYLKGNTLLPHNTFVDVYVMGGPLACLLFCLLYLEAVFRFARTLRKRAHSIDWLMKNMLLLAFIVTEGLILSTLSVFTLKVNWVLLGLALGLYAFNALNGDGENTLHLKRQPWNARGVGTHG